MPKPTPAQAATFSRLIDGEAFPFVDGAPKLQVTTHEASVEKGTREGLFHRAILADGADPKARTSYRYELYRIAVDGTARKI